MNLTPITEPFRRSTDSETPSFVCALCGTTCDESERCGRCGATLVVGVDESAVYGTLHPLCDPDCRVDRHPIPRRAGVRQTTPSRVTDSRVTDASPLETARSRLRRVVEKLERRLFRPRSNSF